ncbi:DUF134 domain-containing protein [Haloimpatiens massiliensis]|uniref:DUF134 domain-containing protein n=1 Tax=Haloimpatiens massiliensis TaxID=1658110 RepID=UPI000C8360C4|nr:DUF134 domain-containing protein [Haloimpatiens massiliensis]
MVRPRKWRRVCNLPQVDKFGPVDKLQDVSELIIMTVEEYETIRLMDLVGLNQEQCAGTMGVARSTVQRIYDDARKKIADSLVNGKMLKIEGGDYKLCSDFGDKENCDVCICGRHRHGRNN